MWLSEGQENKHKLVTSRALGRGPTAEALELTSHWGLPSEPDILQISA